MKINQFTEQEIIDFWHINAKPWINAIREGEIESRVLVTNKVIVDTVLQRQPKSVLDIGCGEGWLVHELVAYGIDAIGIDIVPELIESASHDKSGRFQALSYEDISANTFKRKFDVAVCNFSMLGKESVEHVFQLATSLLNEYGAFIVQTLHPVAICGEQPYQDGWRHGSWAGFSKDFTDPAPWYYRTEESWQSLFVENGVCLIDIVEPLHPKTKLPVSIIFVGVSAGS